MATSRGYTPECARRIALLPGEKMAEGQKPGDQVIGFAPYRDKDPCATLTAQSVAGGTESPQEILLRKSRSGADMTETFPRLEFFYHGVHEPFAVRCSHVNDSRELHVDAPGYPDCAAGKVLTVPAEVASVVHGATPCQGM